MHGNLAPPLQPLAAGRGPEPPDRIEATKRKAETMNAIVGRFLRYRITQGGLLLVVVAAAAATIAWSRDPAGRVKLGGTWVGRYGDITWTSTYSPDSSGQSATVTLQWMTMSAEFETLIASIGGQTMSLVSGSHRMVSPDTAKGWLLWYTLAEGIPSTTTPVAGQVKAINILEGEWHLTSPTTALGKHNLKMYLPDAQGSLVPADDAVPFLALDFENVPHQKVR